MTRDEHMAWCKSRAIRYCDQGKLTEAFASMMSDLRKHPETEDHLGIELGSMMFFSGHLDTDRKMREFIEGFR